MGLDAVEASPAVRIGGEFKDQRMDLNMTPAAKAFLKKTLADMGMKFTGYGVIRTKNEAEVEAYCKLAKEFGINIILTEDPVSQFKYWDKIGKKYGITMVVHHHGSDSVNQYWQPEVMKMFVSQYGNVKANPDLGHWARSGIYPQAALKVLAGEVANIHIKDQKTFGLGIRDPVPIGDGVIDFDAVFAELDRQGFRGYLVIEYETDWDNPIPGITKSVKFLKNK